MTPSTKRRGGLTGSGPALLKTAALAGYRARAGGQMGVTRGWLLRASCMLDEMRICSDVLCVCPLRSLRTCAATVAQDFLRGAFRRPLLRSASGCGPARHSRRSKEIVARSLALRAGWDRLQHRCERGGWRDRYYFFPPHSRMSKETAAKSGRTGGPAVGSRGARCDFFCRMASWPLGQGLFLHSDSTIWSPDN